MEKPNFERFVKKCRFWGWGSHPLEKKCNWCGAEADYQLSLLCGLWANRILCRTCVIKLINEIDRLNDKPLKS
jgi:hypothetical protein